MFLFKRETIVDFFTVPSVFLSGLQSQPNLEMDSKVVLFTVYLGVYWVGLRSLRAIILINLTDVLTYLRLLYSSSSIRLTSMATTFMAVVSYKF